PVLGVKDLDLAERAIRSIGSFSAIILDWIFDDRAKLLKPGEGSEEVEFVRAGSVQADRTLAFLERNDFYSLVYVYSNEDVEGKYGSQLRERFAERIKIQKKPLEHPAEEIIQQIEEWRAQNQNLSIPFAWTATINRSIQKIFKELADADKNWVQEIGNSAQDDGVNGEIFVIEILEYLLAESLAQNTSLLSSIRDCLASTSGEKAVDQELQKEESVAKLFRRLFYTKLNSDALIMTGDICEIGEDQYGIVITPECDIKDVLSGKIATLELLTFSRDSFDKYLQLGINDNYKRTSYPNTTDKRLQKLRRVFNQSDPKYHVLPSFPFDEASFNLSVVVDFSKGSERFAIGRIKDKRRYKLNSPFIQQVRQRYISHLGRVGVPSLPLSLRDFNLK
ncbi:MAG: hypothetical protein AABN34_27690, partial [Acidobacteriota bacterium]